MAVREKIEEKEKGIRQQLEALKSCLNEFSVSNKNTPNDWSYLAALGMTENALLELNQKLDEIKKSKEQSQ